MPHSRHGEECLHMAKRGNGLRAETPLQTAENYQHPTATAALRPEVGTQAQFRKRKPPRSYHYDSSLSPSLEWDSQNAAREKGEALLQAILEAKTLEEAKAVADKLQGLSKPFLNWAGKAERLSFDVPTLPLFIHERFSTRAILETLKGHIRDRCLSMLDLFGDPQHPISDQVLRAYEHKDNWTNRMVLGDSLVVMNSLLHYEGLGGQVQMIYMDPPYGVKFGSNFQPFVRKRDVIHNDDEDMTRDYVKQPSCEAPAHVLFPQLVKIAERYLREKVWPIPPADILDVFLSPYYGWVIERLVEALAQRRRWISGRAAMCVRWCTAI